MSHQLELSDEIYAALIAAARAEGMTPGEWLTKNLCLPAAQNQERPLAEYLVGLTGVINSDVEPRGRHRPMPFSSAVVEKLVRQGLKRP